MVEEVIAVFQDPTLFTQMVEKCSVNTLLKHRCGNVHKLLTDIDFAFAKLKTIIIVSVGKSNAFIESEMRLHMQLCGSKRL